MDATKRSAPSLKNETVDFGVYLGFCKVILVFGFGVSISRESREHSLSFYAYTVNCFRMDYTVLDTSLKGYSIRSLKRPLAEGRTASKEAIMLRYFRHFLGKETRVRELLTELSKNFYRLRFYIYTLSSQVYYLYLFGGRWRYKEDWVVCIGV